MHARAVEGEQIGVRPLGAEDAGIAEPPHLAALVFGADSFAGVLDYFEVVPRGNI